MTYRLLQIQFRFRFLIKLTGFLMIMGFTNLGLGHSISGEWKLKFASCGNNPEQPIKLKPVPNSEFSPDLILNYKVDEAVDQAQNTDLSQFGFNSIMPLRSTKSITPKSCTNPEVQKLQGIMYSQDFEQEILFSDGPKTRGIIRGVKLGTMNTPTVQGGEILKSPSDCDPTLGFFTLIEQWTGSNHALDELERKYFFKLVDQNHLNIAYFENNGANQCGDDVTQLNLVRSGTTGE